MEAPSGDLVSMPHSRSKLRLRSTPTQLVPVSGARFLRHIRSESNTYSRPSGLALGRMKMFRVLIRRRRVLTSQVRPPITQSVPVK